MKILIAEDEIKLALHIRKGLEQAGHSAEAAHTGSRALEMAASQSYDLILLDLMLPGCNGFDVLKSIREFNIAVPVIVVSALNQSEHVVRALDEGAVDYLKKPFDFNELLARVRIIQRKKAGSVISKLIVSDLEMDLVKHEVRRAGTVVHLTQREFSLLEFLLTNANRILSKSAISEKVWDADFDMSSNVIEVTLYQLRKKINANKAEDLIETHVGFGYKLNGELKRS